MDLVNVSGYPAINFDSTDQNGNLFHVIAMRQSFRMTAQGLRPLLDQLPVRDSDAYIDDDPSLGIYQESDLVLFKPNCDVIVNAVAHAPRGEADRFKVRICVARNSGVPTNAETPPRRVNGSANHIPVSAHEVIIDKTLVVTGEREFRLRPHLVRSLSTLTKMATLGVFRASDWQLTLPKKCTSLPLRYTTAFGGVARIDAEEADRAAMVKRIGKSNCLSDSAAGSDSEMQASGKHPPLALSVFESNPLGTGYTTNWYLNAIESRSIPAPRVEHPDEPITVETLQDVLDGKPGPLPAGFAAVDRTWLPRRTFAGTPAKNESADDKMSHLPSDFDLRYWNAAPVDQQCPYLVGNEIFTLENLCAADNPTARSGLDGGTELCFALPGAQPFLTLEDRKGRVAAKMCQLDTVYIDPERQSVELVWRAAVHVAVDLREVILMLASTGEEKQALQKVILMQEAK